MSDLKTLNENFARLRQLLDSKEMDPDPSRTDFHTHEETLHEISSLIDEVLGDVDASVSTIEDESVGNNYKAAAAAFAGETACLLFAANQKDKVSSLFSKARSIDPKGPRSTLFNEIERDYTVMVRLNRAEWLLARERRVECNHIAEQLVQLRAFPETAVWAKKLLNVPRPIKSAPMLYTLNGFGTSLWGKRDKRPDGTYIATRCLVFLFLPVLAIDAYWVQYEGGNSYLFFGKVPLSAFARWWRRLLVSGALALLVSIAVNGYWDTPEKRLARDLKAAHVAETEGSIDRAEQLYEQIVSDYGYMSEAKEAAEAVLRIESERLPKTLTEKDLLAVQSILKRFESMLSTAKRGAANFMSRKLIEWAKSYKGKTENDTFTGRIGLLNDALSIPDTSNREEAMTLKNDTFNQWARLIEPTRPMDAVHRYLSNSGDASAVRNAAAILERLKTISDILPDLEKDVNEFASAVKTLGLKDLEASAQELKTKTDEQVKSATSAERAALLESQDEKQLTAALKKSPRDQGIASSLAAIKYTLGKYDEAARILEDARGEGGVFPRASELEYADCLMNAGRLDDAASLLQQILDARLFEYLDVQKTYTRVETEIIESGMVAKEQADTMAKYPKADMESIRSLWLEDKLKNDPRLTKLRNAYLDMWDVMPAAIKLGTVNLRRAEAAFGNERTSLLNAAENAFLSVRAEASDDPAYHIGLAQVYFRLGKSNEGEKEMTWVLDRHEPLLSLSAAHVYRELGLNQKASAIAHSVYETKEPAIKERAALLVAAMTDDLTEKEKWLRLADVNSPQVSADLLEVEGEKLYATGDMEAADAKYEEAERIYSKQGDAVSLNNAAVSARRRAELTGNPAHLKRAALFLEKSLKQSSDNALVIDNLAGTLRFEAELKILGHWIEIESLGLTGDEAEALTASMMEGPLRSEVRQQLKASPELARSAALLKQAAILSPTMASLYSEQAGLAFALDDAAQLKEIAQKIRSQKALDTGDAKRRRDDWMSGKNDSQIKSATAGALSRLEKNMDGIRRLQHAPTTAAALTAMAQLYRSLSFFEEPSTRLDSADVALTEAQSLWPKSGVASDLAVVLLEKAILNAKTKVPALNDLWNKRRRDLTSVSIIALAMERSGADTIRALSDTKEMKRIVTLIESGTIQPSLFFVIVSKITGAPSLKQMALQATSRESLKLSVEIDSLLDPSNEDLTIRKSWLNIHEKPAGLLGSGLQP
jgi:hypothetical protein